MKINSFAKTLALLAVIIIAVIGFGFTSETMQAKNVVPAASIFAKSPSAKTTNIFSVNSYDRVSTGEQVQIGYKTFYPASYGAIVNTYQPSILIEYPFNNSKTTVNYSPPEKWIYKSQRLDFNRDRFKPDRAIPANRRQTLIRRE